MFTVEDAGKLIALARKSIEYYLASGRYLMDEPKERKFKEERGAFVSLHTYPGHQLRGCIGFIEPIKSVWETVIECSVSAAFRDPRFPKLTASEWGRNDIVVEISVLSIPDLIYVTDPEEYLGKIQIGRDGLIIERGINKGILLPQVPVEFGWGVEEFLNQCCLKAGLRKDEWEEDGTVVYKFSAHVWKESAPKGEVIEENLNSPHQD
ncbi:MAG: TIGR00296 family protein [Candidatus Diapherotrites archaeon]